MRHTRTMLQLTRRDFLATCATLTAAGLLVACAPTSQPSPPPAQPTAALPASQQPPAAAPTVKSTGPKKGGTLTMARTIRLVEFNPLNTVGGHNAFMRAMFNTLLQYDEKLQPQPQLAEKWDLSADGKVITLKLRQGVKFHSGREFTSADVKFTHEYASQDEVVQLRSSYREIKKVETPDKYTVVLSFDKVNPGLFDTLDMMYIIDKETFADRSKTAIGTGPFKLEKFVPNDRVEMVAFKDYWDTGKPYLDGYVAREIPDLASIMINLEAGAIDCVQAPSAVDMPRLKAAGDKYVIDMGSPGQEMFNLAINVKAPPFTDKRVRRAMAWSIDRARLCRTALGGLVEPTCLMWPTHSWAYFKDLEGKVGYDLDKAKALLKEAGLEKGFETEILSSTKRGVGFMDLAQMLQADLKKIGVNAKITDAEEAVFQARMNSADIVMATHSYGRANRDPGMLMAGAKAWYNEKEGNWTRWNSDVWDGLRKDLNSTLDKEKRLPIARKLQEMALDECFTNPIAAGLRGMWAYTGYVKGFSYDLSNTINPVGIWLDK